MPSSAPGANRRVPILLALLLGLGFPAWPGPAPGIEGEPEPARPGRTPWTTSRVVGSPDPPPPFDVVRAFPNLKFDQPVLIACDPEGGRLIVGEQSGALYSFADDPDATADLFLDLRREIGTIGLLEGAKEVEAVYGLAFHPDFERNRQCFICYTLRGTDPSRPNLEDGTRVSRFTVSRTDPPRVDPASEEIVLTFLQGGHNGGDLHFGPDGMLYISTGDAASPNPPDPFDTGQDISDLLSSILRLGRPSARPLRPLGTAGKVPALANWLGGEPERSGGYGLLVPPRTRCQSWNNRWDCFNNRSPIGPPSPPRSIIVWKSQRRWAQQGGRPGAARTRRFAASR